MYVLVHGSWWVVALVGSVGVMDEGGRRGDSAFIDSEVAATATELYPKIYRYI